MIIAVMKWCYECGVKYIGSLVRCLNGVNTECDAGTPLYRVAQVV